MTLTEHVHATNWTWLRPKRKGNRYHEPREDWWIGRDDAGRRWLVKMTGSNYAYREHVFAALAQRLGISCQSSHYLTIPLDAAPMLNLRPGDRTERHQLALWFFDEHEEPCLCENCPMHIVKGMRITDEEGLEKYLTSGVKYGTDLIRGEILGYLCGQFEPPGRLFTVEHEFVQIDNELMFATGPVLLWECQWLRFSVGRRCARDICRALSQVSDRELLSFAEIPRGYVVKRKNNVRRRLIAAKREAQRFLAGL